MRLVHQKILRITPLVPADTFAVDLAMKAEVLAKDVNSLTEKGRLIQRDLDVHEVAAKNVNQHMEKNARRSYKSEWKMTDESYHKFLKMIRKRGHGGVFEHGVLYVEAMMDRGESHEWVRHRIASHLQESTRYCDYLDGHVEFVVPVELEHVIPDGMLFDSENTDPEQVIGDLGLDGEKYADDVIVPTTVSYFRSCAFTECEYRYLRSLGRKPQYARGCLTNWLKTEVGMTINLNSLRNFLTLRTAPAAHPQFRPLAQTILDYCRKHYPEVVEDIG